MMFVDTGFLFAISTPRDRLYARSMKWAAVLNGPMLTTEYVIWEMVNALSSPKDRRQSHALLESIQSSPRWTIVPASSSLYTSGLAMHRQHGDKEWSLTDCISFIVMRERAVQRALTHDHHFEQAGFEALLRRDP